MIPLESNPLRHKPFKVRKKFKVLAIVNRRKVLPNRNQQSIINGIRICAESVRFISEKESEDCEYLGEISVEQTKAAYGGTSETEKRAKEKLKMKAVTSTNGGNALRITDRERTERKGEYIPAKLILYADCFKCAEKEL